MLSALAEELGGVIGETECVLVSMLAGVTLERLEALFPGKRILRIMPNTPCAVGSGMLFLCRGSLAAEQDAEAFRQLMACAGRIDEIPEKWMDAASAVAGCGPAFAYMFVQALADGGVECGLPRAKATEYAAQMLLGSAQMVLQTGAHPEKLKDDVCSPGGSTIAGVHALENAAFRAACMDAVTAAYEKPRGWDKAANGCKILHRRRGIQPPFPLMTKEKAAGGEKETSKEGVASEQTPHPSSCPRQAAGRPRPFRCSSFSHTNRFAGFAWLAPLQTPLKRPRRGCGPLPWIFPGVWFVRKLFSDL